MKVVNICLSPMIRHILRTSFIIVIVACISVITSSDEDYDNADEYITNYMNDDLPLFYSYDNVMERLHKEAKKDLQKVNDINYTYHTTCRYGPEIDPPDGKRRPFIVIEGNHRHSRDVIGIKLARRLGGRLLKVPPKCMGLLSTTLPPASELRRVFFGLCLYTTSYNVKQLLNIGVPVVLNGYWTDQAAFVIEKRFNDPPPTNHVLYQSPKDLFPPDMIFYLNKDEGTNDETFQRRAPAWKQRTMDIYKNFQNPSVHVIEMDAGFFQVVDTISSKMDEHLSTTRELSYNPPRYLDPRYF